MQQTLSENETFIGEIEGPTGEPTQLIRTDDGAAVREGWEDPHEGMQWQWTGYESEKTAFLHFGLVFLSGGSISRPEGGGSRFVPTELLKHGQPAIAAWLRTRGASGAEVSASRVAERMGVTDETVNNYFSRFRRDLSEQIDAAPDGSGVDT